MRRTVLLLVTCAVSFAAQASDGGAKAGIEAGNVAALYTADAEIFPPGGPIAKGRDAIEKTFAAMAGAFKRISLRTREILPQGKDLAVEIGEWTAWDAAGKPVEGKAIVVWKKVGKAWLFHRDMWSDNGAPAPAATPASTTPPAK